MNPRGRVALRAAAHHEIGGTVATGFESVRDAFAGNFAERGELGGAVCVVVGGEVVVDLWGGERNRATGAPWCARHHDAGLLHDQGAVSHGAGATALARPARLRRAGGHLLARVRPAGKEDITVRQLLAHQAGLFAFDERVHADVVADLDRLAGILERQRPSGNPAAPGVSRHHARLLRERTGAPRRSCATAPSAGSSTTTSPPARRRGGGLHRDCPKSP
jgi:hypothetical protein